MSRNGYIIILRPDIDFKNYQAWTARYQKTDWINRLRQLLNFIDPANYRGSGREQFDAWPYYLKDGQLELYVEGKGSPYLNPIPPLRYENLNAKKKFALLEEANTIHNPTEYELLFSLQEMKEVYELIDDRDNYEIIELIEKVPFPNSRTLGFDVGYRYSDFSVIADSAIKPTWHPPNLEDMQDIVEHLKKLNEYCLFSSLQDAEKYRQVYLTKNWGEKELVEGEITTIQIREL